MLLSSFKGTSRVVCQMLSSLHEVAAPQGVIPSPSCLPVFDTPSLGAGLWPGLPYGKELCLVGLFTSIIVH